MTELHALPDTAEDTEEAPAEGGYTVGDAAHSIAELASSIHRRFKGWTPTDALKAVEIAIQQSLTRQAMELQYGGPYYAPPPEDNDEALLATDYAVEDDPGVQHETPTEDN